MEFIRYGVGDHVSVGRSAVGVVGVAAVVSKKVQGQVQCRDTQTLCMHFEATDIGPSNAPQAIRQPLTRAL